jgi:hypothetical protein
MGNCNTALTVEEFKGIDFFVDTIFFSFLLEFMNEKFTRESLQCFEKLKALTLFSIAKRFACPISSRFAISVF